MKRGERREAETALVRGEESGIGEDWEMGPFIKEGEPRFIFGGSTLDGNGEGNHRYSRDDELSWTSLVWMDAMEENHRGRNNDERSYSWMASLLEALLGNRKLEMGRVWTVELESRC
ncbi:hypothetical protein MRB53_015214 [Persea americana]|uniref:Uncharacterized protein n=1 Tax=Persea americana TaxID=3435 RepID=A0ACC2KD69_PERAE|nr:hypothetical protein MRB53_015214 [Persea americana]